MRRVRAGGLLSIFLLYPGMGMGKLTERVVTQVNWAPCDPNFVFANAPVDCAFFQIPLDYQDVSAGIGRLSLIKVNATGQRKGTLFVNPGGPGESGVSYLAFSAPDILNTTGGNYDIVSWDPRGVGIDTVPNEILCLNRSDYTAFFNGTIEQTGIQWGGNFTDPMDIAALDAQAPVMEEKYKQLGQKCMDAASGTTLKYIGTAANARDMAALADALDGLGSPVNYWGISYGTLLGAWFVNMFPDRVGHVILDGVVNILDTAQKQSFLSWGDKIHDADKVFQGFTTACALAGPSVCNVTSEGWSGTDVMHLFDSMIDAAHAAEVKNGWVPVPSNSLRSALFTVMYEPVLWQSYAGEFARLFKTVQTEWAPPTNTSIQSRSKSRRQSVPQDGVSFAEAAIYCADGIDSDGTTMSGLFDYIVNVTRTVSPLIGATWPIDAFYCSFWPARAVERYTGPFNKTLGNKVLVIGNTADPITPFRQAKQLADLMGSSATLIRQNGFGHASLAQRSSCVTNVIQAYLNNDTLPEDDCTMCEVDDDDELFTGVTTREVIAQLDFS
ncbi:alpha/beta-hydrolase [Lentinus tigrinus ALCF2SS1-6]|uniref:Alpha/beta-hydrolase n=1 Tax=Lentinus tigrinus ALCF2SS1-6 TaxID=1328759 RepID=A0A5C2S948_9APHY|nr:alpha/beta-hydrolase [Lentinus tigrinus ALCF2SS1-6]